MRSCDFPLSAFLYLLLIIYCCLLVGGICVVSGMEIYLVESRKRAPLSLDQMTDVVLGAVTRKKEN